MQKLSISQVVSDNPAIAFSEELLEAYPKAKVILSVRDSVDDWYESVMKTIWPVVQETYLARWRRWILPKPWFRDFLDKRYGHTFYGDMPNKGKNGYVKHNEMIRRLVPKERLLEYNVKEGWEPLCNFLGKEIPGGDFPRLNDGPAFNALMEKSRQKQYQKMRVRLSKAVRCIGVIVVAWYLRKRKL